LDKAQKKKTLDIVLRCLVFVVLALAGTVLFGWLLGIAGYMLASVLSVFLASVVANAVVMRVFERASLAGIGLYWNADSIRNLVLGLAGGIGAACLVILAPIVVGAAEIHAVAGGETNVRTILYVSILLLFGSAGEEMLFRGYAFQKLIGLLGPFATILPVSVLFAWAHAGNQSVTLLALANTFLWGVLLGWAFVRAGDLWLPIGLHFGWNWVLPLLGVNLSGFTMKMTGFTVAWKAGPFWSGGDYGPEGGVLTCGVLFLLFLYLWKAPIRKQSAPLLPE
jgi:hypothetical protein